LLLKTRELTLYIHLFSLIKFLLQLTLLTVLLSSCGGGENANFPADNATPPDNGNTGTPEKIPPGIGLFEGFGQDVTGGEAGAAFPVTSLANSGPGSLRDALSVGDRNITFTVSGTINLSSDIKIKQSNITLNGFSSPNGITLSGAGIIIEGNSNNDSGAQNIIIQGVRVMNASGDGMRVWLNAHDVVINHVSVLDSGDGNIDITEGAYNVTVSWSLLAGSASGNTLQSYRANRVSHHHNLYFGSHRRNPLIDDTPRYYSKGADPAGVFADIQFNILWNYGWGLSLDGVINTSNVMNNLFKNSGVNGNSSFIMNRATKGFLKGNVAQMDIRTNSQWLTNKAISSTNSNSRGTMNATPTISGSNRLIEWQKVINEAGVISLYPDVTRESEARSWDTIPSKADLNSAWNDG
jgi:pectate lyase